MSKSISEIMNKDWRDFLFEVVLLRKGVYIYNKYIGKADCRMCWDHLENECVYELTCGHLYHRQCVLDNIIKNNKYGCEICSITPYAAQYT